MEIAQEDIEQWWTRVEGELSNAKTYSDTIIKSLEAINDGALVHERNKLVSSIRVALSLAAKKIYGREKGAAWDLEMLWSYLDRAAGWMIRIARKGEV